MSRDDKYTIIGRIFLGIFGVCAFGLTLVAYNIVKINENSTPIEEMYRRQLVVTLDSILDARFNGGCCEEDTDTVSISSNRRLFSAEKFIDIVE